MNSGIDKTALASRIRKHIERKVNGKLPNLVVVTSWIKDDDGQKASDPALEEPIREPGSSNLLFSVDRLVEMIDERCKAWADNIGGMVRFTFRMYCEGNPRPVMSEPLTVYSDEIVSIDNATGLGVGDHSPTRRGEYGQELRHRENLARLHIDGLQNSQASDRRELERLRQETAELRAGYVNLVKVLETAQSQAFKRDLMQKEAHEKSEMLRTVFGKVLTFMPMIIQAIAGGRGAIVNTGENLDIATIRGLYTGLPEDARNELNGLVLQFVGKCDHATQQVAMRLYRAMLEDQKTEKIKAIENTATTLPSLLGGGR